LARPIVLINKAKLPISKRKAANPCLVKNAK